jgi:type II secretory pathway component PulF
MHAIVRIGTVLSACSSLCVVVVVVVVFVVVVVVRRRCCRLRARYLCYLMPSENVVKINVVR